VEVAVTLYNHVNRLPRMRNIKLNQLIIVGYPCLDLREPTFLRHTHRSRHLQCHKVYLELNYHTDDQQPRTIDDEQATPASYAGRAKPNVIINGQDAAFASQTGEIAAM
jgi:hypothetical protein